MMRREKVIKSRGRAVAIGPMPAALRLPAWMQSADGGGRRAFRMLHETIVGP